MILKIIQILSVKWLFARKKLSTPDKSIANFFIIKYYLCPLIKKIH
jgi:hypothetical protein